ncbi:MAG: TorD/DmsD family molecular chaperone, partial [Pseudomonadota bacterium]
MLHGLEIVEPRAQPAPPPEEEPEADGGLDYRIPLYRLLSGVFLEEPSVDFLAAVRTPEALAALAEAGLAFDGDFLAAPLPSLADVLAAEFTALFAASGGFPPVESVRLTGRYQQQPYFDVRQAYRQAGFTVTRGRFHVFEDQLGVELAFVAELLER